MDVRILLAAGAAACVFTASSPAEAQSWEVRREIREANREVNRERREADREMRRCQTRQCAERVYRDANRAVARERREARREVSREIREDYYDRWYRGNGRWYRDGRYWNRGDYLRRYYGRRGDDRNDVVGTILVAGAVAGVIAVIVDDD